MWTDGSQNQNTNFAEHSGLEGDHCCVKAGLGGWRGEDCSSLLHGVCEYHVTELLSAPADVHGEGISTDSLSINWTETCAHWTPSMWTVTVCYLQSLAIEAPQDSHVPCSSTDFRDFLEHVTITGLQAFSEYNYTVTARLDFFNISRATTCVARTCQ